MNTPSFKICPDCGIWIDSYGRCNCNSRVNWNSRFVAILAAAIIALATLTPVKADSTEPPSVGDPPSVAVEHRLYLPVVSAADDVEGQVSWCPSCSPRR